jgi:hypothetical protein
VCFKGFNFIVNAVADGVKKQRVEIVSTLKRSVHLGDNYSMLYRDDLSRKLFLQYGVDLRRRIVIDDNLS